MVEDSVKQRLIRFAKLKCKSVRAFEMANNLTVGYINAIRVSIQPEKIRNIAAIFPDLNTCWLLTGEGEMLKKNDEMVSEPLPIYEKRCERCKALEQTIEAQKQTIQAQQELIAELKKGKFTQAGSASA